MKNRLLSYSFVSIITVAVVNALATYLYLYWTIWWFDNVSHFLGGLAMGFLTFWIYQRARTLPQPVDLLKLVLLVIFLVLVIGVGWEFFEYLIDGANPSIGETYWQDTSYDLISDVVGAIVASLVIFKKKLYE